MLNYTKLWLLLENRGMKRTDLKQIMSANTLAKLGKNEIVSSAVIEKICGFLNCQPGDIMEYISEEQWKEVEDKLGQMSKVVAEQLKAHGVTEEMFATMFTQSANEIVRNMFNGGTKSIGEINQKIVDETLGKKE